MGAGLNTTACLLKYKYDYAVFADTGDETQETYDYIDRYLKPKCVELGVPWITVRNKWDQSLYEYSMERKKVPIMSLRWCTSDFKRRPIRRWLRSGPLKATRFRPVRLDIGIAFDESHRANFSGEVPQYLRHEYPLIDDRITRDMCTAICRQAKIPPAPKSGCWFCFYKSNSYYRRLYEKSPELFKKAELLEQNGSDYPKTTLKTKPLMEIIKNMPLTWYGAPDEEEAGCEEGYCMR